MSDEIEEGKSWGIVELMGHKVVAGLIQKSELLGHPLLRIDVPATSAYPAFTQFYGGSAIYSVTFTSEQVALRTAESIKLNPVSVYVPDLVTTEQLAELQNELQRLRERAQAQLGAGDDEEEEAQF